MQSRAATLVHSCPPSCDDTPKLFLQGSQTAVPQLDLESANAASPGRIWNREKLGILMLVSMRILSIELDPDIALTCAESQLDEIDTRDGRLSLWVALFRQWLRSEHFAVYVFMAHQLARHE